MQTKTAGNERRDALTLITSSGRLSFRQRYGGGAAILSKLLSGLGSGPAPGKHRGPKDSPVADNRRIPGKDPRSGRGRAKGMVREGKKQAERERVRESRGFG